MIEFETKTVDFSNLYTLVRRQSWDNLEPITWIVSTAMGAAAPLIVWLSAENLKPTAIEQRVFARWRDRRFEKFHFDTARYEQLMAHQDD